MLFHDKVIKAAIFDMDGTMFDTERLRFQTIKQASTELFGRPVDDVVLMDSLGLSATRAEALAKQHYGDSYPYKEIRARADELELAYVRTNGVPIKLGLYPVLGRLKQQQVLLAVATSSRREIAEEYLINANIFKYFDVVVCGDEVTQGKPHPEIFATAASLLNCEPESCLMLEDSENGLLSASAAGGLPVLLVDIKKPRQEIAEKAFVAYDSMAEFLSELVACTPKWAVPQLREPFPQMLNPLKVGIHGFGAMGGGYLAQVFSHWDGHSRPHQILAATSNAELRTLVNAFGKYNIHYVNQAFEQTIDHVHVIDMADAQAMAQMYFACEMIALCLPEEAIKAQALLIAQCLLERSYWTTNLLTVLVVLNKEGGSAFVIEQVKAALLTMVNETMAAQVLANVSFVGTVVNRIVDKVSYKQLLKEVTVHYNSVSALLDHQVPDKVPLKAKLEEPDGIDAIKSKLKVLSGISQATEQLSLTLFNSSDEMLLYAEKSGGLLDRLRQVKCVDDIGEIQTIKNKLLNGPHAIVAWYSTLLGYRSVGQGIRDKRVLALVHQLVSHEVKPALIQSSPALAEFVDSFIQTFIQSCELAFNDPCSRVGRDPLRKLQRQERVIGNILRANGHGIETPALEFGAALALVYAIRALNPEDHEAAQIKDMYVQSKSIANVLTWSGDYLGKAYQHLDGEKDAALIDRIEQHFNQLMNNEAYLDWPLRFSSAA